MAEGRNVIEELAEVARSLAPEFYAQVDAIAQIVDPAAWPGEAFASLEPDAEPIDWNQNVEVQYRRSVAQGKAVTILALMGIKEPFDGAAVLEAWAEKVRNKITDRKHVTDL